MRERVEAMKAIWTQDEAEYHGELVDFDPIYMWPKPIQKPHPPIHVGGGFPGGARRAIRYGDGWMPIGGRDGDIAERLSHFHEMAREAGRDPQTLEVSRRADAAASSARQDPSDPRQLRELDERSRLTRTERGWPEQIECSRLALTERGGLKQSESGGPKQSECGWLERIGRGSPTHSRGIANPARQHLDGFAESRVDQIRCQIAERFEYEGALAETRMWDLEIGPGQFPITVEQQVEVECARRIAVGTARTTLADFDLEESLQQGVGDERGDELDGAVQIRALGWRAHWISLV
jgi:alkanesulfonate monooxygenase SsuD/methylene tetrahydromethanopterin reductase-like flavin-dependent oxidoreductase (luciferase family)